MEWHHFVTCLLNGMNCTDVDYMSTSYQELLVLCYCVNLHL